MITITDGMPENVEGDDVELHLSREVARELIKYQLIRCRDLAGVTQTEAGRSCGLKQANYAQLERGDSLPDQEKLTKLLRFFGVEDRIPILLDVLEVARSRKAGGKHVISRLISDMQLYFALEHFATSLDVYEPNLVNGLLQTREYARALVEHAATMTPGLEPNNALNLRMGRQELLNRKPTPLALTMFVEEVVLGRPVGSVDIQLSQLRHLLELERRDNVTIRVIPESPVLRPTGRRPLSILRFTDEWVVGYTETPLSAHYYDTPAAVEQCGTIMGHLHHLAVGADESRRLIGATITRLEHEK